MDKGRKSGERELGNVLWRSIGSPVSDQNGPLACDMRGG